MNEIKIDIKRDYDITQLKTTIENAGLYKDSRFLWFVTWEDYPVIYKYDGKSSTRYAFPKGYYLSMHKCFHSAPDGTVYFGGYGTKLLIFKEDHVFESINSEALKNVKAGNEPDLYSVTSINNDVFTTFARSEKSTTIYKYSNDKWSILKTPKFSGILQLAALDSNLIVFEQNGNGTILNSEGKKIESFSNSQTSFILGKKYFLTYDNLFEVRDKKGIIINKIDIDDVLKPVYNQFVSLKEITHIGNDKYLLFIAYRHDQKAPGFLYDFDAATLDLTINPNYEKLKLKQNIGQMEIDPLGKLWLRHYTNNADYFSVIENGKQTTIKNKK